jgi:formylglycine-generating enzyme required for sulfatase activity
MEIVRSTKRLVVRGLLALWVSGAAAQSATATCPPDSVPSGTGCMDRFEESAWRIPNASTTNAPLVAKIHLGTETEAQLVAAGATQLGTLSDDYAPCEDDGSGCANDVFAVSLPLVSPAGFTTWFQAGEACANSGKRLPTNAEWQLAASGTPDPGPDDGAHDCNTASGALPQTGRRDACVSSRGAFDMVGGVAEWVADWVPRPTSCVGWASFSDDEMCLAGADTTQPSPAALVRGGAFSSIGGTSAGPLAVHPFPPTHSAIFIGFRCAR